MRTSMVARTSACALGLLLAWGCGPHRAPQPQDRLDAGSATGVPSGAVMSVADGDALATLAAARAAEPPSAGYRIGPDDLLDVRIPDLTDAQTTLTARLAQGNGAGQAIAGAPVFQQGLR